MYGSLYFIWKSDNFSIKRERNSQKNTGNIWKIINYPGNKETTNVQNDYKLDQIRKIAKEKLPQFLHNFIIIMPSCKDPLLYEKDKI